MSRHVGSRRQQYDMGLLDHAAGLVRSKAISLRQAAKQYGVPKTTLQNAVQHKYGSHKVGHRTVLTAEEEKRVADWAIPMARIGYGRTRQELATTVQKILTEDGRDNPFKDNKPGKGWLNGFFRRHPDLTVHTTLQLGKERAIVSVEKIAKWFQDFQSYIEDKVGDKELLKDPTRIYNADETCVSLCMKGSQVVGSKGAPVVYHYGNSDKTQLTVMAACSASAHYVQPMIIFPGQRFSYNPLEGFEEAAFGRSDNGWMDSEVFYNWLKNVFIPSVNERNVKKPVLLIIDRHKTHVTMEASNICLENGIEMYCLLEHASHVLQPLDLRLFSSLKRNWRQAVRDWQSEHVGQFVTKVTFARVFKQAWQKSTTVDVAVKGFQESGLFPLDMNTVIKSVKLEPSQLFTGEERKQVSDERKPQQQDTPSQPQSCENREHKQVNVDQDADHQKEASSQAPCGVSNMCEPHNVNPEADQVKEAASQPSSCISKERGPVNVVQETDNPSEVPMHQEIASYVPMDKRIQNIEQELAEQKNVQNQQLNKSPFSKHLQVPTSSSVAKSKVTRQITIPKAITGSAYRKMMEEKRAMKEEQEIAKEKRKADRLEKRKLKEEEKLIKKADLDAKPRKKAEEKKKKAEERERLLKSLEESEGSDSDDAQPVEKEKCYACEKPYSSDYIACTNCYRRFHINCVADDYMTIEGLPFE